MFKSIKTSKENKEIVQYLTRQLSLGPENVIARLAFAFSISQKRKLQLVDIQDSQGKEYSSSVLFGDKLPYYTAMVCQIYRINKVDKNISKYVKLHLDDGLRLLNIEYSKSKNLNGFEFISDIIGCGLKLNQIKR